LKPEPWENVKPCVDYGNSCLQVSKKDGSVLGNEDCLTLNVFTKELNTSNLKPVMFWIHGGAHIRGSSAQFPPDYLIEKPVVFVSINYRLNIFGFFTVNDENAYGNAALKDQVAALEWVQGNIAGFGGDPSRVTICGESSAANSVALLQLSTRARGLFHQVIAESGSALNARYLQRNPLKYAYNIAKYFNVTTETTRDMVEGLQKVDSEELAKAANSSQATGYKTDLYAFPFFPIIEVENSEAIITRSPYQILQSGDFNRVPFMIGFNTNDGSVGLNSIKVTGHASRILKQIFQL
jgi:carboxylesterase type B